MIIAAAVLFALAAVGGTTLAVMHIRKKHVSIVFALGHGIVAAVALVLLLINFSQGAESSFFSYALVLFVIAALGGITLFSFHLRSRPLPVVLIPVHGLIAASAFILLIIFISQGMSG